MDSEQILTDAERDHRLACRVEYAPQLLAALLQQTHGGNDDRLVARAVSLSDKLAHAIVTQP